MESQNSEKCDQTRSTCLEDPAEHQFLKLNELTPKTRENYFHAVNYINASHHLFNEILENQELKDEDGESITFQAPIYANELEEFCFEKVITESNLSKPIIELENEEKPETKPNVDVVLGVTDAEALRPTRIGATPEPLKSVIEKSDQQMNVKTESSPIQTNKHLNVEPKITGNFTYTTPIQSMDSKDSYEESNSNDTDFPMLLEQSTKNLDPKRVKTIDNDLIPESNNDYKSKLSMKPENQQANPPESKHNESKNDFKNIANGLELEKINNNQGEDVLSCISDSENNLKCLIKPETQHAPRFNLQHTTNTEQSNMKEDPTTTDCEESKCLHSSGTELKTIFERFRNSTAPTKNQNNQDILVPSWASDSEYNLEFLIKPENEHHVNSTKLKYIEVKKDFKNITSTLGSEIIGINEDENVGRSISEYILKSLEKHENEHYTNSTPKSKYTELKKDFKDFTSTLGSEIIEMNEDENVGGWITNSECILKSLKKPENEHHTNSTPKSKYTELKKDFKNFTSTLGSEIIEMNEDENVGGWITNSECILKSLKKPENEHHTNSTPKSKYTELKKDFKNFTSTLGSEIIEMNEDENVGGWITNSKCILKSLKMPENEHHTNSTPKSKHTELKKDFKNFTSTLGSEIIEMNKDENVGGWITNSECILKSLKKPENEHHTNSTPKSKYTELKKDFKDFTSTLGSEIIEMNEDENVGGWITNSECILKSLKKPENEHHTNSTPKSKYTELKKDFKNFTSTLGSEIIEMNEDESVPLWMTDSEYNFKSLKKPENEHHTNSTPKSKYTELKKDFKNFTSTLGSEIIEMNEDESVPLWMTDSEYNFKSLKKPENEHHTNSTPKSKYTELKKDFKNFTSTLGSEIIEMNEDESVPLWMTDSEYNFKSLKKPENEHHTNSTPKSKYTELKKDFRNFTSTLGSEIIEMNEDESLHLWMTDSEYNLEYQKKPEKRHALGFKLQHSTNIEESIMEDDNPIITKVFNYVTSTTDREKSRYSKFDEPHKKKPELPAIITTNIEVVGAHPNKTKNNYDSQNVPQDLMPNPKNHFDRKQVPKEA